MNHWKRPTHTPQCRETPSLTLRQGGARFFATGLLGFALAFLFTCTERKEATPEIRTAHGPFTIRFQGSIKDIPESFQKRPFRLRFRVYECLRPNAGAEAQGDAANKPAQTAPRSAAPKPAAASATETPEMDPAVLASCENKYYETTDTFEFGKYYKELRVSPAWTHAFVELLDTDEIDGRYSPGHNPFWFAYTNSLLQAPPEKTTKRKSEDPFDQSNLFFRRKIVPTDTTADLKHDFTFVSQENPIPDRKQRELAERFAPIIIHAAGKKFPPTNLEQYHGKTTLDRVPRSLRKNSLPENHAEDAEEPYLALPDLERGEGDTHLYYHVRYTATTVSGTQPEALPFWRDNRNYRYEKGDGSMVISYWIWYDMNEGPSSMGNLHQGDLESYALLVDAAGKPLRFMVTGHDHIMLDTSWNNINSLSDHPIIFIAHGRESDGGNPTSPYGGFEVGLWAGNDLFQSLADPKDIFPDPSGAVAVTLPADLKAEDVKSVRFGPGEHIDAAKTKTVDLSGKIRANIKKLVSWEEPGWVNQKADQDPDGQHDVDPAIAWFLTFQGRIGKQPRTKVDYIRLRQIGSSPRNAPFKTNIEQHYTFEHPRMDRHHTAHHGDYGPRFLGDAKTPQF